MKEIRKVNVSRWTGVKVVHSYTGNLLGFSSNSSLEWIGEERAFATHPVALVEKLDGDYKGKIDIVSIGMLRFVEDEEDECNERSAQP